MEKTEKRTAEDILDGLEQTDDGYIHYSKVLPAMREYSAQELDAYKARLKELLLKRKQEYHKDCLNDAFINGRFWECQELLELIDKL